MSNRKFSNGISGKGYYIALILCAVAIGISGYLYYRNTNQTPDNLQNDPVVATDGLTDDVQVVATEPGGEVMATEPTSGIDTAAPTVAPGKPAKTAAPVSGEAVAEYAMDCLSYNQTTRDWRVHNGVDYGAPEGTPVKAAADGTVYTVYEDDTMGMTVVIRHTGGYVTKYASLAKEVSVAPGDAVTVGQTIGFVGNTALLESAIGDHVHFSVTCNDEIMDPADFLGA